MKLLSRNLVFGMHGNDVRELQRDLAWRGFDIVLINGVRHYKTP